LKLNLLFLADPEAKVRAFPRAAEANRSLNNMKGSDSEEINEVYCM
jgi:hypothetical protein